MEKTLSIITPVLPTRSCHLAETAASVQELKGVAASAGWSVEWVIAADGPGVIEEPAADQLLRLTHRQGAGGARNAALAAATGEWVFPLDADDLLLSDDFCSVLKQLPQMPAWVAANRTLLNGERTPQWHAPQSCWHAGALAEQWQATLPFHPNTLFTRTRLARKVGGWPLLLTNQDLGFALRLSEFEAGLYSPETILKYRVWSGQTISRPDYIQRKRENIKLIEHEINDLRRSLGRNPVRQPQPGVA